MAMDALSHLALLAPTLALNANASAYVEQAREELSDCFFGTNYEKAVALLTAHTMTMALDPMRAGGTAGSITSKSEGQLSVGFSAGSASGSDWGQTSYGMALSRLMQSGGVGFMVTGPGNVC